MRKMIQEAAIPMPSVQVRCDENLKDGKVMGIKEEKWKGLMADAVWKRKVRSDAQVFIL